MNFYSLQNYQQTLNPLKYTTRKTHIEVSLDSYGLQLFAGASRLQAFIRAVLLMSVFKQRLSFRML